MCHATLGTGSRGEAKSAHSIAQAQEVTREHAQAVPSSAGQGRTSAQTAEHGCFCFVRIYSVRLIAAEYALLQVATCLGILQREYAFCYYAFCNFSGHLAIGVLLMQFQIRRLVMPFDP